MSIEVVSLEEEHLEDAAALVASRYQGLRQRVAFLPSRCADVDTLLPLLREIAGAGPGVIALHGERVVGFPSGWLVPSFRGKPSVFSPEWANGADLRHSRRMYEELYSYLAVSWVADGYFTHLVSLLANDHEAVDGWHWLGFGMVAADALRNLDPVSGGGARVDVRRARLEDVEQVMALDGALWRHVAAAPTFLVDTEERDRGTYEAWLQDPEKALWLAYRDGEPVAYMGLGPASDDASTIIRDEKTASVSGAFTREGTRGIGVATALLSRGLAWARAQGYQRCAVDFEPMNPLAARFWLRHFEPVCYTLMRQVDERASRRSVG
jgi:GNAT superfamily N-acetyltransferase